MDLIAERHWKNASLNDHTVATTAVKCNEEDALLFQDSDQVKAFLKSPARDLHDFSTLCKEFKEMLRHVDRHHNEVVFKRCDDRSCCQLFRSERLQNISLFATSPDAKRPGHLVFFLKTMIRFSCIFCAENVI